MSDAIIVALISSAVSLITILVTAKGTRDEVSHQMDKSITVIETRMEAMDKKIEEHNGYARMFSENIPAIRQHMTDMDRRLDRMEGRQP